MHDPVRIGVVGLGNFGLLHAETLSGMAEAKLVALVDNNSEKLAEAKGRFGDVPGWENLEQGIHGSAAEAWIVASSTESHVSITEQLLKEGYTVLVEKPLAADLSSAQTLSPLVADGSSNLMVGHIVLFNSEFCSLLEEAKRRGQPIYIDCVRHRPRTTMELFPGESPLHLTMVHDLYCVLALMGRAEPVEVTAQIHCDSSGNCDLAIAQLRWESGTVASCTASFLTPSGMSGDGFDRMEVFGKDWAARIQPNPRPIEVWDERARWPMALEIGNNPAAPAGMLAEELRCFCRVVRKVEPVPIGATFQDALQVQGWLQEMARSAQVNTHAGGESC